MCKGIGTVIEFQEIRWLFDEVDFFQGWLMLTL